MKNRVQFKYEFIVFLYAYLRQIDLSLDRCRWTNISELRLYYQDKITPDEVVRFLSEKVDNSVIHADLNYELKEPSFSEKLYNLLLKLSGKSNVLTVAELSHLRKLLLSFNELLQSSTTHYNAEIESLRLNIALFYSYRLEHKLRKEDYEKAMRIEHYMSNEYSAKVKMEEFSRNLF